MKQHVNPTSQLI